MRLDDLWTHVRWLKFDRINVLNIDIDLIPEI